MASAGRRKDRRTTPAAAWGRSTLPEHGLGPGKPETPDAEALKKLTESLVADRTNAQHAAQLAPLTDPSSPTASPALFGVGPRHRLRLLPRQPRAVRLEHRSPAHRCRRSPPARPRRRPPHPARRCKARRLKQRPPTPHPPKPRPPKSRLPKSRLPKSRLPKPRPRKPRLPGLSPPGPRLRRRRRVPRRRKAHPPQRRRKACPPTRSRSCRRSAGAPGRRRAAASGARRLASDAGAFGRSVRDDRVPRTDLKPVATSDGRGQGIRHQARQRHHFRHWLWRFDLQRSRCSSQPR